MHNSLTSILVKVLVVTYYRLNTGFFLMLILFGFGVLRGQDHLLLAAFYVDHPLHLIIPVFLFALYQVKSLLFIRNQCHHKKNEFLYIIKILPVNIRIQAAGTVLFLVNLPVLMYALFILFVGMVNGKLLSITLLVLLTVSIQVLGIALVYRWLLKVPFERKYSSLLSGINQVFPRRLWLVFTEWLIRKELVFLLLTKAVSIAALSGCLIAYNMGDFDRRLLDFGLLISFVCTSIITFLYVKYESLELSWKRNLPFRLYERFSDQVITFIPLALPELILLINWPLAGFGFFDKMVLVIYGFSIMLLLLNLQWTRFFSLKMLSIRIFWAFILFTFLLLYGIGEWWIIGINSALSIVLLQTYYNTFEYQRSEEK